MMLVLKNKRLVYHLLKTGEGVSYQLILQSSIQTLQEQRWHFLAQSLGTGPEMLGWYVLTFIENPQAHGYTVVAFHPEVFRVSLFIFSQGMARLCKDIY